jgi:hypothetical protein
MKYVVPIMCIISVGVTFWCSAVEHEREAHDQSVAQQGVIRHDGAAPETLRTVSAGEQPFLINIEERPCGDAHQICTGITIQRPSNESPLIIPHAPAQIHQSVQGTPAAPIPIIAPLSAPRESAPKLDMQSYLSLWLRREVWLPTLINGIAYYYGMTQIQKLDSKLLIRLGLACVAIPSWYTVMRTQRMEHGIPALITAFLGSQLALASD